MGGRCDVIVYARGPKVVVLSADGPRCRSGRARARTTEGLDVAIEDEEVKRLEMNRIRKMRCSCEIAKETVEQENTGQR